VRERVATVLFMFPDSHQVRHMGKPPRLGSRVRSPRGAVCTVAEVVDWGSDTYTATCVGKASPFDAVPKRAAGRKQPTKESEVAKVPHRDDKDLAADLLQRTRDSLLLQRAKDALSPRAIRRRWRRRNYIP
jgi:hypothetical protein